MNSASELSFSVKAKDATVEASMSLRARYILGCFHERHVPLTPDLAEALAALETARRPSSDRHWGAAFEAMGQTLGMAGRFGHSQALMKAPANFHTQIAEPLLRRAAAGLGAIVLLGTADWYPDSGGRRDYATYCRQIEARLGQLMQDPGLMGAGFWAAAGLALLMGARGRTTVGGVLPDPERAKLLYGVEPAFPPQIRREFRDLKPRSRSDRDRSGIRPREGGVQGVIQTTRVEDFGDAALSEFLQPRAVLLNKLLHEGYLVRHRPPKRRPRRDVLAVAVCSDGLGGGRHGPLCAAAWADAALRGQIMLNAVALDQSDLVFMELHGREARLAHLDIETAAPLPAIHPLKLTGDPRRLALTRSGLAEPLVNRYGSLLPEEPSGNGHPNLPVPHHDLRDALTILRRARAGKDDLDPDQYGIRLVVDCVTGAGEALDFNTARLKRVHELGYANPHAIRYARIFLPDDLRPGAGLLWQHGTDGQEEDRAEIAGAEDDPGPLEQLFGMLSMWMLQSLREVLDGAT